MEREITSKIKTLKTILPEVFDNWKNSYQAVFHLTENIAGKIDGIPLNARDIPFLYKGQHQMSLYDHTYGCPTRCTYCGYFTKSPPDNTRILERQLNLKLKERDLIFHLFPNSEVSSIYFGGGTPTILSPYLLKRLIKSYNDFEKIKDIEITVEAHPKTINQNKLETLSEEGVNRISIGIQSLNEDILKECNRRYSAKEAIRTIELAVKTFPLVNIDIIYGLRNQTLGDHLETLKRMVDLGVNQITAYAMWLKEGSIVSNEFSRNETEEYPNPEQRARMYLSTKHFLEKKNFVETLLGWFSKSGKEVKIYPQRWDQGIPCIGIGAGAYSYGKGWHYNNLQNWKDYSNNIERNLLPFKDGWLFGTKEKALTQLMWKIKTGHKFKLDDLERNLIKPFIDKGLIDKFSKNQFELTDLGKVVYEWMIGNTIERTIRKAF